MNKIEVTKRRGRRHYYTRIDGKYVSTGQTDQRIAMQIATKMHQVGVEDYRNGKRELANKLTDLIEEHLDYLRDRDGRDAEHLRKKRYQLTKPVDAGIFTLLKDVKRRPFEQWLDALECGAKTRNEYLTAWNVFLDWLVYEDRLDENPIKGRIRRARVSPSEERKRRAFTVEEISRLLEVAERHELLYLTAVSTGARFRELKLLLWEDVREDDDDPCIVLRPKNTKNRKGRTVYLTPELAEALRAARSKAKTPRVFRRMPSHHTVTKHIKAAGIEKKNSDGIACFHSLRHTFTTTIARITGDARLAQRMADHADLSTTQRYLHTERSEHAAAMGKFPTLRATGRATQVVQSGQIESVPVPGSPSPDTSQVSDSGGVRPDVSEPVVRRLVVEPGGIEPPSRDSPHAASTRVVADLISALCPPATACCSAQFG